MYLKLKKILKKTGFTLVEILVALSISSITIVILTKISIEALHNSLENQAADEATQISSRTFEILLKMRNNVPAFYKDACTNFTTATSPYIPADYTGYPQYKNTASGITYISAYLKTDASGNFSLIPTSKVSSDNYSVKFIVDTALAQQFTNSNTFGFVQDNSLNTSGSNNNYYRYIGLSYNQTYKIMLVTVIMYWNLYGNDNFYSNVGVFSLSSICS